MSKILFLLSFGTFASFAALPPLYQSANEIAAIVKSAKLSDLGAGRSISSITRKDNIYTVVAGDCAMNAKIKYKPLPHNFVGPAKFDVVFSKVNCLP